MNRTLLSSLVALLLVLLTPDARAQVGGGSNPGDRILREHTLLFPVLQQNAVVSTHVGIREGLAQFQADQLPLADLGPRDVKLTGLQQTLDLSLRFTPWLALYLAGEGQAIIGTNGITLLRRGAAYDVRGDAGLAFRVLRNEASGTQLTLRGFLGASKGRNITVLPLLQSLVNQPGRTLTDIAGGNLDDLLIVPTKEHAFGLGAYLAQTFGQGFSLQAGVTARRTVRTERLFDIVQGTEFDDDLFTFRLENAVAVTYDFAAHSVPIALMGEYRFDLGNRHGAALLSDSITASTVALGVYYSGRPNLQLGLSAVRALNGDPLQGTDAQGQPAESESPKISYGELILRYVW
ncbi:hypothetical protein FGE12_17520 [Aggregicoccus sp. 17bor-14]|uniref:hypothetical protein n=1 Tax=Myxococcaceae TaxID=31 RepID=UPI00129CD11E|nr:MULTISPECIES: hypothetical protein [Myxococcaceae]MBF5044201.1 hypothetical protein [Simulacricoccus sp. 17bor-14]MRI89951.1 hypothetical protein [Aggregicoccus sp. 17bor-14]